MKRKAGIETEGGVPLYQLKITLIWSTPPIWRRLLVRADMPLDRLHDTIQQAMPWTNSHLHQFIVGRTLYGVPDWDCADLDIQTKDERRHTLAELAPVVKKKFIYEYDFGDGWQHEVKLEKVVPPDARFKHPVCLAGANACPPDDCGGISGYYDMLAILRDPKHDEFDQWHDWLGDDWDAERFDLAEINRGLKRIKA